MSSKPLKLPSRPKPPCGVDITSDVNECDATDIVFTLFSSGESDSRRRRDPNATEFSFVSSLDDTVLNPNRPSPNRNVPNSGDGHESATADVASSDADTPSRLDIETMYNQAVQFLDVSEELQNAPEVLRTKCEVLNKLGNDLDLLVSDMKTQSEAILNKSTIK